MLLAARQQGAVWRQKYFSLYGSGMSAAWANLHTHRSIHTPYLMTAPVH